MNFGEKFAELRRGYGLTRDELALKLEIMPEDIIKLEKHPVYYLVELLDKIYDKFGDSID